MAERKAVKKRILKVTAVITLALLLLCMGMLMATKFIYTAIFPRFERSPLEQALNLTSSHASEITQCREAYFMSEENRLRAYIYGDDNASALVVIAPGLSDGGEDYTSQALAFVDLGYKVFTFDTTGSFESEGKNSVGFSQEVLDLQCALDFIKSDPELNKLPLYLFGHSRGGYACAMMCNQDYDIRAVATVGAVNSEIEITLEWSTNYVGAFAYSGYPALYAYQTMIFGGDIISSGGAQAINEGDIPALVIHCENDVTVSIDGSSIYAHKDEVTNPKAQFMLYENTENAGHTTLLFTKEANAYREEVKDDFDDLYTRYNGEIPESTEKEFLQSIDPLKAQEANKELIKTISDFFKTYP
ncbi:MAG: alpha/beta hydrolase [Clostridia bacterium]|nr:alpha/beta hydrolase [Clostridia bacterium]